VQQQRGRGLYSWLSGEGGRYLIRWDASRFGGDETSPLYENRCLTFGLSSNAIIANHRLNVDGRTLSTDPVGNKDWLTPSPLLKGSPGLTRLRTGITPRSRSRVSSANFWRKVSAILNERADHDTTKYVSMLISQKSIPSWARFDAVYPPLYPMTTCCLLLNIYPLPGPILLCHLMPHLRYCKPKMASHSLCAMLAGLSHSHSIFLLRRGPGARSCRCTEAARRGLMRRVRLGSTTEAEMISS
jgi:hypothetical protein